MARSLVLEVGSDEIPARYLLDAVGGLKERGLASLKDAGLSFESLKAFGTPRRLVLYVEGLEEKSAIKETLVRGPSKKVALDGEGRPTKALAGFAKSLGIDVSEVIFKIEAGGEYVYGVKTLKGLPTQEVLGEILPDVVMKIDCPRPLRWGDENWRWFRPIRWVLCLYGDEVPSLSVAGITSGRESFGHRSLHPEKFSVETAEVYFQKLRSAGVILDPSERRRIILEEGERLARGAGGQAVMDENLLRELVSSAENPSPFLGRFDAGYTSLPEEVLITSMKHHQKYFPIQDLKGNIFPAFIGLKDGDCEENTENVRRGNEWILKARLEDARFFYDNDTKIPLKDRLLSLKGVRFLKDGGTLYEKAKRIERLSEKVALHLSLDEKGVLQAKDALLAKCDLVTAMVSEFPELQGVIGGKYAEKEGFCSKVSGAIYEQYLPKGSGDVLPSPGVSSALALSDKIDTLCTAFGLGIKVKGSYDPLGLRRSALGVLAILDRYGYDLDLLDVLDDAFSLVKADLERFDGSAKDRLWGFFKDRVESNLLDMGYEPLLARAALGGFETRPSRYKKIAEALKDAASKGILEDVVIGWRRTSVLTKSYKRREVDVDLFSQEQEKALYERTRLLAPLADRNFLKGEYAAYLELLASLKGYIDRCLDEVLIMAKEENIKSNRLALLGNVSDLFTKIADFKELLSLVS